MADTTFVDGTVIAAPWLNDVNDLVYTYFTRTADEVSAGVTPTNYEYRPGDPRRYGAVGDGTTSDDTAFANWALVIGGKIGYIPNPPTAWKLSTSILIAANTTIRGDGKHSAVIHWYGAGPCFRCVGTVNVGGANRQVWSDFKIITKGNASPQDGLALLWGGANIVKRIWITWDATNRPRHCIIADQNALLEVSECHFDGYTGWGILGPNTGEYTDYGTSTSSYITVARIFGNQFSISSAGTGGVAIDIGEVILIEEGNNFAACPTGVRLGNVTAFSISGNYFERSVIDFNTSTNHGPGLLLANTSTISGAALTVTNRTQGTFGPNNHVELYQNAISDNPASNEGVIEVDGFAGTLTVTGNQFGQPRSHCVYVRSGTASKIIFDRSNYHSNASLRDGRFMDVFVDTVAGASASIFREDARRAEMPDSIASFKFGGHKYVWTTAMPTSTAGSVLEGETFAAGDIIALTTGQLLFVTTGGTFGAAQASTATTTAGSADVVLSGSDGTIVEGTQITIAGVTGTKTVKQVYLSDIDSLRHLRLDSTCDTSGSARAITYAAPVIGTKGLILTDGVTAPSTVSGLAQIYVDTADGDLKVKFGDGTTKTIVVDT